MTRRELCSFRWNGTHWTRLEMSPTTSQTNEQSTISTTDESIRIATLNILADCFPWFIEMAIRSSERYEWLCNGLTALNPTIIGLNEVTRTALEQLQQCPFIRENYFITESVDRTMVSNDSSELTYGMNNLLSPHGCVILSKFPLLEAFAVSVSGSAREAVVGKVQLNHHSEQCVHVCAHHTTAYQTPKNAQLRAQQIRDIVEILEPLGLPFLIFGDLNLHYSFEDAVVVNNNLIDAWTQTHFSQISPFNDRNEGYTFDTANNSLIPYYIPGECRRMRLDRILFSRAFPAFAIQPCMLWANEPIKSDNYLFPSDHFGLYIDLVLRSTSCDNDGKIISIGEPDPMAQNILTRNAENNTDQQAYRLGLTQRTTAIVSHLFWLGARTFGLK